MRIALAALALSASVLAWVVAAAPGPAERPPPAPVELSGVTGATPGPTAPAPPTPSPVSTVEPVPRRVGEAPVASFEPDDDGGRGRGRNRGRGGDDGDSDSSGPG